MDHDARTVVVSNSSETLDLLAGVLRFSKSLRARKGVLIAFLFIAAVIGGVHYVTAERVYQSQGELFITLQGTSPVEANNGGLNVDSDQMPTFEKMIKSDKVIQATIRSLPREHYHDFFGVRASAWERVFRARLSVSSARNTNVMTVGFRSSSPETAQIVVDTLFTEYIRYLDSTFKQNTHEWMQTLNEQHAEIQRQIDKTSDEHALLLEDSNIFIGDDEKITNIYADTVKTLNQDLLAATEKRNGAREFYTRLNDAVLNNEDLTNYVMQMAESVGTDLLLQKLGIDTNANSVAARMWDDIVEAEAVLRDKREYLGPNHPEVRQLNTEIITKRQSIQQLPEEARQAATGMMQTGLGPQLLAMAKRRYELAVTHEQNVRANLEEASRKASKLNGQLARIHSVKANLDHHREALDRLSNNITNVALGENHKLFTRITSPPQLQLAPVSPRLSLVVVVSLFLGFAAACVTIYVMDLLDDRFHSPDDLRSQLGVPILAMVRRLEQLPGKACAALYTYSRPNSSASEAFRTLRTAIDFSEGGARRLTISSTEPGDGKTTIVSNLAVAFAQSGKRTLLIDGDMRRPGLTRLFERNAQAGLSTILRDNRPIVDSVIGAVQQTQMEMLHVLPAGPRPANPVELLTNPRLEELLAWAESSYDQILIDAPPSLAVTDAAIIGRLVDGAILTVRPDKNRRKLVLRASEALTSLGCNLLGVVINSVQARGNSEYGYAYGHGDYGHDDPVGSDPRADVIPKTNAPAPETGSTIDTRRGKRPVRVRRRRAA